MNWRPLQTPQVGAVPEYDERLMMLDAPCFFLVTLDDSSFETMRLQLQINHPKAVVRFVRGWKSKTIDAFFDEIGAALQFPYYFGENWPALGDSITDLEWAEGDAYIVLIGRASALLSDPSAGDRFNVLICILTEANEEWRDPNPNDPSQRPPTAFHVVFQCREDELGAFSARLTSANATYERLHVTLPTRPQ